MNPSEGRNLFSGIRPTLYESKMKSFFRKPDKKEKYILMGGDYGAIAASLFLSFLLQISFRGNLGLFVQTIWHLPLFSRLIAVFNLTFLFTIFSLVFGLVHVMTYYIAGLYEIELVFNRKKMFVRLTASVFFAMLITYVVTHGFWREIFVLRIWGFHFCSLFLFLVVWRYQCHRRLAAKGPFQVLVIGSDDLSDKAMRFLCAKGGRQLFSFDNCSEKEYFENVAFDGNETLRSYNMVVYPFGNGKVSEDGLISLMKTKFRGLTVCNSLDFYRNSTGSFPVFNLDAHWLINLSTSLALANQLQLRIKRVLDIVFSLVGLGISLPFMIISGVLVKTTSKGPLFFIQERLGLNEKPFLLYKFRTMVDNAEKATGPVWAQKDDPRVTSVGRLLRKTRFDELPQFFNVLKGDMSFIGPRPIRKFFADKLSGEFPYYFLRFYVKPGLTGWGQVSGDYGDTIEGQLKKLEYELFYIHEYSLLLDAVIVLKTIQKALLAKGQ